MPASSYASRVQALSVAMANMEQKDMMILLFCSGETVVDALLESIDLLATAGS